MPLPLIGFLVHKVRSRLRSGFQLGSRVWAEMTSVLADTIPGIRVVKAFAQERREIERFRRANDRVLHANDRVNRLWSFFGPVITLLTDAGMLVVWIVGVWQVFHHNVTVGTWNLFLIYIARFYMRLESMSRMVSATQRAAASAQRVFGVMDREATVQEPLHPVSPGRLRGRIEFRDVGFRYGTRPVVEHIDLAIEPGEMIGLVGPSGSGKTTLVNLACRFYDVAEGAVLVDGTDVRSFPIEEYRRHIGLVLQEPFLFYGTIAENIAYGRPDASREEILDAAKAARAHEFILRLPDGYDSLVGERGQSLSGGERQRISIARALLDRSAHPDPRRSDLFRRYGDRARNPARVGQPDPRADDDRHRPPPEHAGAGEPAVGDGTRADRRGRYAAGVVGPRWSLCPAPSGAVGIAGREWRDGERRPR